MKLSVCIHRAPILFALTFTASSVFAVDHNCRIGRPNPSAIILDGCDDPEDKELTAPITCESTPRGTATGHFDASKIVKHNGRYQPQPVIFTGDCGHETLTTTNLIPILLSGSGGPGDDNGGPLGSVHWSVGLGRVAGNKNGGAICFDVEDIQPGMLSPDNLIIAAQAMTDIVWTPFQTRVYQILAPECFVQIDEISPTSFRIDFYTPEQVFQDRTGTNLWHGVRDARTWRMTSLPLQPDDPLYSEYHVFPLECYRLKPQAEPFVSYAFAPSGASSFSIREIRPGCETKTTTYSRTGNSWIKQESDLRTEMLVTSVSGNRKTMTWTTSVSESDSSTIREVYLLENGRELLLESIVDPDGLALVTSNEYYLSGASRYKLRKTTDPNGAWTTYEYDSDGRETEIRTGWLSGGENDPCKVTLFSYAPFLPTNDIPPGTPFDNGKTDSTTPRIETVLIGGVPVSKTLRSIASDSMGYRIIEEVRLLNPSETNLVAAWTAPENPRSLAVYMPDSNYRPCSRLPMLVVNEDGTATHYDYDSGVYTPGEDGMPGTFEPMIGGAFFRTIATHGTRDSFGLDELGNSATDFAGIPLKTTRDITIETRIGKYEILREIHLCTKLGEYERIAWATTTRNNRNQVIATRTSDGSITEQEWIGNLLSWTYNENGIRSHYTYDSINRLVETRKYRPAAEDYRIKHMTFNSNGDVISTCISGSDQMLNSHSEFDAAGRLIKETDASGMETTVTYSESENGLSMRTEIVGAHTQHECTNAVAFHRNGQIAYVIADGLRSSTFRYGVLADGKQWTCQYFGAAGEQSPRWEIVVNDPLGREELRCRPSARETIVFERKLYNAQNNIVQDSEAFCHDILFSLSALDSIETTEISQSLFSYDQLGQLVLATRDVNRNGHSDLSHSDIVVSNSQQYVEFDGSWWKQNQQFTYPDNNSDVPMLVKQINLRLTGLGTDTNIESHSAMTLVSEVRLIDSFGNETISKCMRNRDNHLEIKTHQQSGLSTEVTVLLDGLVITNQTTSGKMIHQEYDVFDRLVSFSDGLENSSTLCYDSLGRLEKFIDQHGQSSFFLYDERNRMTAATNSFGCVFEREFDSAGRIVHESGSDYPVRIEYDSFGQVSTVTTYRNSESDLGDTTEYQFDPATGWLIGKTMADGRTTEFSYNPDGTLQTRKWARGVTTSYQYDEQGNLCSVSYSDDTPTVSLVYDRMGKMISSTIDGIATNLFYFSHSGLLTNETQNGYSISRAYNQVGRECLKSLSTPDGNHHSFAYEYDTASRLRTIVIGTNSFSYSYAQGGDSVQTLSSSFGVERHWTYRNDGARISSVENLVNGAVASRYEVSFDDLGRPVSVAREGTAFETSFIDEYELNSRSEILRGNTYYSDPSASEHKPVTAREFHYTYDMSGNRMSALESAGGIQWTTLYQANALNQCTSVSAPPYLAVRGRVADDAVVTVNGNYVEKDHGVGGWSLWSHAATATQNNSDNELSVLAVIPSNNNDNPDVVQKELRTVPLSMPTQILAYDADGNMTNDSRFVYAWDAENRITSITSISTNKFGCQYEKRFIRDGFGRVIRTFENGNSNSFIWDGNNILYETGLHNTLNVWGLELDGENGGGGAGGLLAVVSDNNVSLPLYDPFGNICQYVRNGSIVARREYDPFGNAVLEEGEKYAYWFSTQRFNPNSGLYEYQYRLYSPRFGRWLSRDPLGESRQERALYLNCENNPFLDYDVCGLADTKLISTHTADLASVVTRSLSIADNLNRRFGLKDHHHKGFSAAVDIRGQIVWERKKCCNGPRAGQIVVDQLWKGNVSGTISFSLSTQQLTVSIAGAEVSYWYGVKGSFSGSISGEIAGGSDLCENRNFSSDFSINGNIGISALIGGSATIRLFKWVSVSVGIYGGLEGNISFRLKYHKDGDGPLLLTHDFVSGRIAATITLEAIYSSFSYDYTLKEW